MPEKVPDHVPKIHEPNEANGLSPEAARQLDYSLFLMESGDPDGVVDWDESSETWSNIHPADIGTSSHALHATSSNDQVAFGSAVHRAKNQDPGAEYEDVFDKVADEYSPKGDEEDA